jgi:hypothetical protein
MYTLTLFFLLLSASSTMGNTRQHHFTGIRNTAKVARQTSAIIRMDALPAGFLDCRAVGWTSLNDEDDSGQWVKAGIGYRAKDWLPEKPVALWWTSTRSQTAEIVGCVPLHTEVKVSIDKRDGIEQAFVTWKWDGGQLTQAVQLPGWITGPGTHPTKVEVFAASDAAPPKPVSITIRDITLYPGGTDLRWQISYLYQLIGKPTFSAFTVEYSMVSPWAYIEE